MTINDIREAVIRYNRDYPEIVADAVEGRGEIVVSVSVTNPRPSRNNCGRKFVISCTPGLYVTGSGFAAAYDPYAFTFNRRPSEAAIKRIVKRNYGDIGIRRTGKKT